VHRINCRTSLFNTERIDYPHDDPRERGARFVLHRVELTDSISFTRVPQRIVQDEACGLGVRIQVMVSFERDVVAPHATASSCDIFVYGRLA